jgi:hypothetical protein
MAGFQEVHRWQVKVKDARQMKSALQMTAVQLQVSTQVTVVKIQKQMTSRDVQ